MPEDPKKFLTEVKAGIGESQLTDDGEIIDFEDAKGEKCRLATFPDGTLSLTCVTGRILLHSGQAKRLANSLERFAVALDLGGS